MHLQGQRISYISIADLSHRRLSQTGSFQGSRRFLFNRFHGFRQLGAVVAGEDVLNVATLAYVSTGGKQEGREEGDQTSTKSISRRVFFTGAARTAGTALRFRTLLGGSGRSSGMTVIVVIIVAAAVSMDSSSSKSLSLFWIAR